MALARNIATVGGGTLVSRLLAYCRDAWIAAILGAGPVSEAFFAVFQVVNFVRRLLAEGSLNSAFVPLWLGLREGEDGSANADRFTRRSLLLMFCITGFITLLVMVFAHSIMQAIAPGFDAARQSLAGYLLDIAAPYIALAGLAAVLSSALNAEGRVLAVTLSTITFNIVILLALFFVNKRWLEEGTTLAAAIVDAGLVQLIIVTIAWLATGKRWRRRTVRVANQTKALFKRALPSLIATGIPQLKLIAAAAVASSSPAAVSWLYYANRLYELPLGVASIAISAVIVPHIASSLQRGDPEAAAAQSRGYEIALGLTLPAAAGFAVLAWPITGGLFERGAFTAQDTHAVATALMAICAGLPGHALEKVLGAISFAHEDTRTPMLTALCGLAATIAGALLLFPQFGHVGIAAAIALSAWVGAGLLAVVLSARGWLLADEGTSRRLRQIVRATIMMSLVIVAALLAVHRLLPASETTSLGQIALLIVLVPLGVAVYAGALHLYGVANIRDLVSTIRRGS